MIQLPDFANRFSVLCALKELQCCHPNLEWAETARDLGKLLLGKNRLGPQNAFLIVEMLFDWFEIKLSAGNYGEVEDTVVDEEGPAHVEDRFVVYFDYANGCNSAAKQIQQFEPPTHEERKLFRKKLNTFAKHLTCVECGL